MHEWIKQRALKAARNRQGIFPSLDGIHFAFGEDTEREGMTVQNHQAIIVVNATRIFSS